MANLTVNSAGGDWAERVANLPVTKGFRPKSPDRLVVAVYGGAGFGKTTWAAGNPRALILDFDDGSACVPFKDASRLWIPTLHDAELTSVQRSEGAIGWDRAQARIHEMILRPDRPYDTLVFDTIDRCQEIGVGDASENLKGKEAGRDIRDTRGGKGGYSDLAECVAGYWRQFKDRGVGLVLLGHEKYEQIQTTSLTGQVSTTLVIRQLCYPTIAATVRQDADYIFRILPVSSFDQKSATLTTKTCLVLDTPKDRPEQVRIETKRRLGIPGAIPVPRNNGWEAFVKEYKKACEAECTLLGIPQSDWPDWMRAPAAASTPA